MLDRQSSDRTGQALLIQTAIGMVAIVLIAVIWMFTLTLTRADEREAVAWLRSSMNNLALSVEWQVESTLQQTQDLVGQAAHDWAKDPDRFDADTWLADHDSAGDPGFQMVKIGIDGVVQSSSMPILIGRNLSHDRVFTDLTSSILANAQDDLVTQGRGAGQFNVLRRLRDKSGQAVGYLLVSFDPWRGMQDLPRWDLGKSGLIALLRDNGDARVLVPAGVPTQIQPSDAHALFAAAGGESDGTWIGKLLADGVVRRIQYHRLRDFDLMLVIGTGEVESLGPTHARNNGVTTFAALVSLALVVAAILLILQVSASRRREERLALDRSTIELAYTELAQAKANAEAKTNELQATLAGMTDGVMMLDADMRLVNWNERFSERIGLRRDVLRVGQKMEVLLRAQAEAGEFGEVDIDTEVARRMADMRATTGTVVIERQRPNGVTVELRRSRLPPGGLVTLYTDITARKRAVEAQQEAIRLAGEAAEQKSRFVAIVSHEIRTPLNAVINCLGLLDESELAPAQRRLADTAREAGEALMELVNDILELSNAEAGKLELRPSVFELQPLLEGVRAMFQMQAGKRGVRLVLDVSPELPRQIRADSGRLRQVMMNLVSNAGKFSSPGVVSIKATMMLADGKPMLSMAVQDQGPAITPEDAAKLFVPFSRLRNARSSGAPGTGLGLAICDRLVRAMGGRIGLRLAPTGGNEFHVDLPLEAVAPQARVAVAGDVVSLIQRPRARILIVEDIPANHLVAATLLRREGFKVDVAESGPAGIAMVQRVPYDLVFMDLIMPDMDGLEATRRIRALSGPMADLPIVALTATTSNDDRTRCLSAGMDDMLGKPIRPVALFSTVQRYLGNVRRPGAGASAAEPGRGYESQNAESGAIIDDSRLVELRRGLSPATLLSLVEQCLGDMRERIPVLRTALAGGDPKAIEAGAHALGGLAASYALAAIERRMRRIIRLARAGQITEAQSAAEGMEGDLAVATETIRLLLRAAVA